MDKGKVLLPSKSRGGAGFVDAFSENESVPTPIHGHAIGDLIDHSSSSSAKLNTTLHPIQMTFSLSGEQLPLSEYFGKSGTSKKQSTSTRASTSTSTKRKIERVELSDAKEPPKKKGKHKENDGPSWSTASASESNKSSTSRKSDVNKQTPRRGTRTKALAPSLKANRRRHVRFLDHMHDSLTELMHSDR